MQKLLRRKQTVFNVKLLSNRNTVVNHVNQSKAVNSGRRSTHDYITTIHNQNTIKGKIRKNGTMSTTKRIWA